MNIIYRCIDCSKMKQCPDAEYSAPACPSFQKEGETMNKNSIAFVRNTLTKTQFRYWYDYYVNDMSLADISIAYDVHISTVCHVLTNARKRLNAVYGEMQKG